MVRTSAVADIVPTPGIDIRRRQASDFFAQASRAVSVWLIRTWASRICSREQNQHCARSIGQCARFGITHQVGQFPDIAGAATRHEPEFGKMTTYCVD
jgi:hypothetical protein